MNAFWIATLSVVLVLGGCSANRARQAAAPATESPVASKETPLPVARTRTRPSDEVLRTRLTALQYNVTQQAGTEPPFQNEFWNNHEPGLYVDIVTGEPLFSSTDKFDSGTGWPSFTRPLAAEHILDADDSSHGMNRTEVVSHEGRSHLGHVFDDGPAPTGKRFCINSASLRFIPVSRLEAEGYEEFRSLFAGATAHPATAGTGSSAVAALPATTRVDAHREEVILAGGCFWGMQDILRKIPGVLETEVGYSGGTTVNPGYDTVHLGTTGHAESVRIVFDPTRLSFAELLENWFFRMHDPTSLNRQGNDLGSQYRSAIFYTSEAQRQTAEAVKAKVAQGGHWGRPIVTEITAAGAFTRAEEEHQDYLQRNPGGYTCHYLRDFD